MVHSPNGNSLAWALFHLVPFAEQFSFFLAARNNTATCARRTHQWPGHTMLLSMWSECKYNCSCYLGKVRIIVGKLPARRSHLEINEFFLCCSSIHWTEDLSIYHACVIIYISFHPVIVIIAEKIFFKRKQAIQTAPNQAHPEGREPQWLSLLSVVNIGCDFVGGLNSQ